MRPNFNRLSPASFGAHPPWIPVPTFAAANFLGVSPRTLLLWHKEGIGPEPVEADVYVGRTRYWQPAKLLEWYELQTHGRSKGFQAICQEWVDRHPMIACSNVRPIAPERPSRRLKRRRQLERAKRG